MGRRTTVALVALAGLAALAAGVVRRPARGPRARVVLLGPRLIALADHVEAVWLEYPKTLVSAPITNGVVGTRTELVLPEQDATVLQLVPFAWNGGVGVAILEHGLRRTGVEGPLRRIAVRGLAGAGSPFTLVAEGADGEAGANDAPAAIIAVGPCTAAGVPGVIWRRRAATGGSDLRLGPAVLSLLHTDGSVGTSELLGQSRSATAAGFQEDGGLLVGGFDAGRPFVVGPDGEVGIDVPTPAVVASIVSAPGADPHAWAASGLDGTGRLFVVGGAVHNNQLRGLLPADTALIEREPDLADAGVAIAPPALVPVANGMWLLWPAARAHRHELRARHLDDHGDPDQASTAVLRCAKDTTLASWDVALEAGGRLAVVGLCAAARAGKATVVTASF